jgi:hypothetical protein
MSFCQKCGSDIGQDKSCQKCSVPQQKSKKKGGLGLLGWLGILTVGVAIVASMVGAPYKDPGQNHGSATESAVKEVKKDPFREAMEKTTVDFNWSKGGFDNVMVADFSIKNNSDYSIKDVEITCLSSGGSGTVIDANKKQIFEKIKAKSTKKIKSFNMGFIHNQAASTNCTITDLSLDK